MLNFDPTARIDVVQSLTHPWLTSYHDPEDEPNCPEIFEKWREIEKLETMEEFREALWNEIEEYRREVRGLDQRPAAVSPSPPSPSLPPTQDETPSSPVGTPKMPAPSTVQDILTDSAILSEEPTVVETPVTETPVSTQTVEQEEGSKEKEDTLPDALPAIGPDHHRRSITTPTDPLMAYHNTRRSSFLQSSRQGSTYNSPLLSSHVPAFAEGSSHADAKQSVGTVPFPTQGYVLPARSRTGSTTGGGEVTRRLLRTLSTVSIHESVEGLPGGLAGMGTIGKYIAEVNTEADAPPSEVPRDFGMRSDMDDVDEEEPKRGGKFMV